MDLLSHSECKQILINKGEDDKVSLKFIEIIPATEVIGFLGEYYRLILHCHGNTSSIKQNIDENNNTKFTFFIKSVNRSIADENLLIFKKETDLFASLLKDLQAHTSTVLCPKSFYSRPDLLALEDLNSLGYEKCQNPTGSLKEIELKAVLRVLAALHAASIIHELHTGCSIETQYPASLFEEITVARHIPWYKTGLQTILELSQAHPAYQTPEMQNFIENKLESYLESVYEMQNPSKIFRNVLCHRDPWYGNVLIDYHRMVAVLVDFQTVRYCPPCVDIIFALFMNLDSDSRKLNEKMYLDYYYEQLENEFAQQQNLKVEEFITKIEFLKSYEEFKLFGYLYRAIAMTILAVPKEFVTNEYKFVNRSRKLFELMKVDKEFCKQIQDCIGELLDFVLS